MSPASKRVISAADFMPARRTLPNLRRAAKNCQGCELFRRATQTVFGAGPNHAALMLIGEVPGDQEDLQGKPFVGPAGRLLDEALQAARIARHDVYLTNAVKHFKWEPRGTRCLHAKPSSARNRRLSTLARRGDRSHRSEDDRLPRRDGGTDAFRQVISPHKASGRVDRIFRVAARAGHVPPFGRAASSDRKRATSHARAVVS